MSEKEAQGLDSAPLHEHEDFESRVKCEVILARTAGSPLTEPTTDSCPTI